MNIFSLTKTHKRKKIARLLLCPILLLFCLTFLPSCHKEVEYFDYVSELRSNIFLAKTEDFNLRIYATVKESPYKTDGIARERFSRLEAYLLSSNGDKTVYLEMQIDGQSQGGEMSYDNVKGEYFYSCPLDVSALSSISCIVQYGESKIELTASSVLTKDTLSPQAALQRVRTENSELFASMTDKYGFAGEIYIRLLYEEAPYYYVGIIDRSGGCNAFLMNAETGKILARRQS